MATLSFTRANFQVSENGKVFTPVTITRTDGIGAAAVTVSLTAGTATANQDYTSQNLTVNFNAGETSKTVNIPILEDSIAENSETINLTLINPVNSTVGTQSTATLTIIDNDKTWAGYADTILDYFDSGAGPIPGPYGIVNGIGNIPVNLDLALGDDSLTPSAVSLPTGSFLTVGFTDEKVVDGPGNDIFITEEGIAGEQANIYVSSNYTDFTFLGLANGGNTSAFDLSSINYTQPVRAVKIVGLDNNGLVPGFDVTNVQALNRSSTAGKITLKEGHSVNDPHLATFDGAGYDFQAVGEFTLVKSTTPTDDFEIQTRQQPWKGSTSASSNSAIAIKSGGQKIAVYADRSPKLLINDLPVTLTDGGTVNAGGNSITLKGNKYEITTANKDLIQVNDRGSFLNINIGLADNRNGKVVGLLGNDNGQTNDEFALRNGTAIGGTISNDRLYGDYGNSWRITQPTSLFNYAAGTNTSTFTNPTFPQKIVTIDSLTAAQRAAAEKIARDAGITDPGVLKDAIVDIFLTNGAPEFIQGALEQQKLDPNAQVTLANGLKVDDAGNTVATARDIGKLTTRQSFNDFIGYYNSSSQDGVDYYKFTIDQKSAVTLSVGGIAFNDGELRLELRNDKDEVIRFTDNTNDIHALLNPDSERTTGSLLPGTYFARVTTNNSSKGGGYNFSASAKPQVENSATFRKPVFVIPGIGGSLWDVSAPDRKEREEEWYSKRGLDPDKLVIDPLGQLYSGLIASLKNAGYQEGKDLFIVPYDWRLAPAPTDGTSDGKVSGITALSITKGTYEYGVDYLGHYLKQASEAWSTSHNGQALDSVDIIAHSTGGLIARAYMQSNAYGGQFSNLSLPLVDNLITIGVPNSGSPKAWNILNNDWNSDKVFATILRNLAYKAYDKLRLGQQVDGNRVTKQSIISATGDSDFNSKKNEIEFINQYFPSIQALLSTDDFGVVVPEKQQNKLLLDLNADSGIRAIGFNGKVSELYGDKSKTINSIEAKISSKEDEGSVQSLTVNTKYDTGNVGDVFYKELYTEKIVNSGDGTVLTKSATLINTSNSSSVEDKFFDNVDHGLLPSNTYVIDKILSTLNQNQAEGSDRPEKSNPFLEAYQLWNKNTIAGNLSNFVKDILDKTKGVRDSNLLGPSEFSQLSDSMLFSIDPVEGFIVDSQGRRLGYSNSTGALNEIPNSVWFGGAEEGIGFIKGKSDPAIKLQLSGLGENHQVTLFGVQDGKLVTAESSGFLAKGQTKQVPITFTQIPVAEPFTLQKATDNVWKVNGSGKVKVSLLNKSTTQLNEIGIFKVDATNKINGIAPGAAGFAKAAIESGSVVFTALPDPTTDGLALNHSFKVNNGERLGFFLVANGSVEEDLKTNNFSNVTTSVDLVKPDTTSPTKAPLQVKENQGVYTLDWKQGDKNLSFNFKVDPTPDTSLTSISSQQGRKEGEVLDIRSLSGPNVQATFTIKREAAYNDSVSFYKIDDVIGTVTSSSGQKFKPGDSGYIQAALNNTISGLNLTGKNGQTVTVDKVLQGGSLYAPILMSNVTASNPTGDNAFTAFSLGNADRTDHVRLLGSNTFGFEDLIGGGDKDFNDIIVQTSFKTV